MGPISKPTSWNATPWYSTGALMSPRRDSSRPEDDFINSPEPWGLEVITLGQLNSKFVPMKLTGLSPRAVRV